MPVSQIFIPIGRRIDTFLRRSDGAEMVLLKIYLAQTKALENRKKYLPLMLQ